MALAWMRDSSRPGDYDSFVRLLGLERSAAILAESRFPAQLTARISGSRLCVDAA